MVSSCNIWQLEGGITSSERLLLNKALFKGWLVMTSTSMCVLRGELWLTISILPNRHLAHDLVNLSTHNCLFLFVVCKFVLVFDDVSVALRILNVQENCTWPFWLTSKSCSSRISSFRSRQQIVSLFTRWKFRDWRAIIEASSLYSWSQPRWIISCNTSLSRWWETQKILFSSSYKVAAPNRWRILREDPTRVYWSFY